MTIEKQLRRHLVYPSATARQYLCVCAARDRGHALKIARQLFRLERSAYAIEESRRVTA